MNKLVKVMIIMAAVSGLASAQVWTYEEDFKTGTKPHGIVVDANDRIWIGFYAYSDTLGMPSDTIPIAPIYVYEPDGSQASFSPIKFLTIGAETDTIDSWCRGLSLDHNGNVLFVGNQVLYRIDYTTGEGMNSYLFPASGSLVKAAADGLGFTYLTKVVPGGAPIMVLDEDFAEVNTVVDSNFIISRSLVVTSDGKDLYHGVIYGTYNGIVHYHSDDGAEGTWSIVDTIYGSTEKQVWGQILDWDRNGLLWVGTYWDVDPNDFTGWYGLDPTQSFFAVDTIGHNAGDPAVDPVPPPGGSYYAPRGVAWSVDGLTAYTADFDGGVVKKWTNPVPAVPGDTPIVPALTIDHERGNPIIAVEFTLHQNYPNPFNPATTIPFDLKDAGLAKLVVYDVAGREVATLVNEPKTPGQYRVLFDASELPSGMYIYQLEFKNRTVSKRMTYVK